MRKSFEVKIYAVDGTFKSTLKTTERISDIRFASSINSGQAECEIELDRAWESSAYSNGDFARVYCYDSNFLSGRVIFTGQINRIDRLFLAGKETVKLRCL